MTCNSLGYRTLLTMCLLTFLLVCMHMLPMGSAQERPPRPKQAEGQDLDNAADVAGEDGPVAANVIGDVAIEIIVDEEGVANVGMGVGGQDPQTWLLNRYVRVNCALARRACKLSKEEERKLSQFNGAWVDKQLKESIALPIEGVAAGIARFLGGRAAAEVINLNGNNGDPQQIAIPKVRKKIDAAIEEALEPEHKETFQRECESRDRFRKQAMAAILISALDNRVFLSQQQRDELEPEVAQWLTKDLYWQFYFQNDNYIPD
ncbi:MAG: hypothetical protein ABI557_09655, partial [Aureliella sp.]